jgi:hypothetical protein
MLVWTAAERKFHQLKPVFRKSHPLGSFPFRPPLTEGKGGQKEKKLLYCAAAVPTVERPLSTNPPHVHDLHANV